MTAPVSCIVLAELCDKHTGTYLRTSPAYRFISTEFSNILLR